MDFKKNRGLKNVHMFKKYYSQVKNVHRSNKSIHKFLKKHIRGHVSFFFQDGFSLFLYQFFPVRTFSI
jgi:hypothetical protein